MGSPVDLSKTKPFIALNTFGASCFPLFEITSWLSTFCQARGVSLRTESRAVSTSQSSHLDETMISLTWLSRCYQYQPRKKHMILLIMHLKFLTSSLEISIGMELLNRQIDNPHPSKSMPGLTLTLSTWTAGRDCTRQ